MGLHFFKDTKITQLKHILNQSPLIFLGRILGVHLQFGFASTPHPPPHPHPQSAPPPRSLIAATFQCGARWVQPSGLVALLLLPHQVDAWGVSNGRRAAAVGGSRPRAQACPGLSAICPTQLFFCLF